MTQPHDPFEHLGGSQDPNQPDYVPVEDDDLPEEEAPRRAASAQFVVDTEVGSEAALRHAMDPANQSLAEALRLSFRILQVVILVLVVLFFASGFETVRDGQTGVLTRWGDVVEVEGQRALSPGLHFTALPYPISEFITFEAENRNISLRDEFFPRPRPGVRSLEQMTEDASVHDFLTPGQIGYVITHEGDIAHARISARYRIEDHGVFDFVQNLREQDADRLVRLALKRAVVHVAAELNLQQFIDLSDEVRSNVQAKAQEMLDQLSAGIRLDAVNVTDAIPPLAIRRIFGELPRAQEEAQTAIEEARQRANERLVRTAGERYRDLAELILRYEAALQRGHESHATTLLAELNSRLDSGDYAGQVSRIIERARAYQSHVEQTLGNEYSRFSSLLPAFRDHPELVIKQRWLEAYARVLGREDAEVWYVPAGVGNVRLDVASLHELRELRQRLNLDRRERRSQQDFWSDWEEYVPWMRDMHLEGPGRQLEVDEEGRVRPLGRQNR